MASNLERRSITTALPLSAVDPGSGSGTTNSRISAGRHQRHGTRFRLWKRRIATPPPLELPTLPTSSFGRSNRRLEDFFEKSPEFPRTRHDRGQRLTAAGYDNLELRLADGGQGWAEQGPFDKIIVTAAPELVPAPLLQQLKPGGRLIIPAGLEDAQELMVIEKSPDGRTTTDEILPVVFSRLITRH